MSYDASFSTQVARLAEATPRLLDSALGTGATYADLFYERTRCHQRSLRQQIRRAVIDPPVQRADHQVIEGVGIRVLEGNQVGFAATDVLSLSAVTAVSRDAAAQLTQAGAARRALSATTPSIQPELPADAPDTIAASEKEALVRAAAEAAFSLDGRVRRVQVDYQDRVRRVLVATSEGTMRVKASMMLGLRVDVTLAVEGKVVTAHAIAGGAVGFGYFFTHPPEQVAREAVERARRLVAAKPLPTGARPVVLASGWGGVWLHEAVGHLLEADVVAAGAASLVGCMGQSVASPEVTLVDDATWPGGRGTEPFDDEGTPASPTLLIEDGVLHRLLTDRRTAHRLGLPRTGHARRQDYRHLPLPRMTNLLLQEGSTAPADLIADVADGLYVAAVGHGSVRPGDGYAFDVLEGYRIQDGRLGAPVMGVRLVGSGPEVLQAVVGVGSDVQVDAARGVCEKAGQVVPVSVGMPTVLIREMQVERCKD